MVRLGLALLVALGAAAASAAESDALLRESHPWARFGKGAWRQVRIITESFDEDGNPSDASITDNKTTVEEVTADRVTLKVEVTVELGGQRFASEPQIVTQGYAGETVGQTVSVRALDPQTITIDGEEIRCETQQLEIAGGVTREKTVINYVVDRTPAILRRESTMTNADGTKTMQQITSEVRAVDMIRRVLDVLEPKTAYLVRVEQKNDRGTTSTWSWHVTDVPGEIVDECSKKLDSEGRLVRRTTLELIDYGSVESMRSSDVEFSGPQPQYRNRRARRRARR
ncbi:MAG: hypothetical protein DWQ37_12025 [Planctomycetota bacterium]|nr:MAG: hypothetical protein DWQ37_12025 [Planctomycetota bacterium]